jgi:hypothetical protein
VNLQNTHPTAFNNSIFIIIQYYLVSNQRFKIDVIRHEDLHSGRTDGLYSRSRMHTSVYHLFLGPRRKVGYERIKQMPTHALWRWIASCQPRSVVRDVWLPPSSWRVLRQSFSMRVVKLHNVVVVGVICNETICRRPIILAQSDTTLWICQGFQSTGVPYVSGPLINVWLSVRLTGGIPLLAVKILFSKSRTDHISCMRWTRQSWLCRRLVEAWVTREVLHRNVISQMTFRWKKKFRPPGVTPISRFECCSNMYVVQGDNCHSVPLRHGHMAHDGVQLSPRLTCQPSEDKTIHRTFRRLAHPNTKKTCQRKSGIDLLHHRSFKY